jgi:predicted metal-dependent hydrolase
MQVRFPKFDFSKFRAHWAANPEFAQSYNAFSIVPAYIEPYLVKVMTRAKEQLDSKYAALHQDVAIFNKQEFQHCKQHIAFNKFMHQSGYAGMLEIERAYNADYERFLKTKSLKFNVAYCEGFEAMGCAAAVTWFSGALDELLEGADPYAVELWKWHLAEEFEHRTVCYDMFKTMYGQGFWKSIVNGYFYRLYGFFYATRHIGSYTGRCAAYLLATDREGMSAEQLQASKAREKAFQSKVGKGTLPVLLQVLSPFYNPGHRKMPTNMSELLARYAQPTATTVAPSA